MKTISHFKSYIIGILFIFIFSTTIQAQVGIGTITPDPSSILDMSSTTSGLLVPRMTLAERNAIAAPATGLMIYQTDSTPGHYVYDSSTWNILGGGATSTDWALTGNTGTTAADYVGTNDDNGLRFRTASTNAFVINGGAVPANRGRLRAFNDGTAALPIYSWTTEIDMGLYRIGTDIMGVSTAGIERIRVAANGDIGINSATPLARFHPRLGATDRPTIYSELFSGTSNWSAAEFSNTNTAGGTGSVGTGFIGYLGQTTNGATGWAGWFNGNVFAAAYFIPSEERWKKNIVALGSNENILDKIMSLKPKSYNWRTEEYPGLSFSSDKTSFGFVAQELNEIFPELVVSDKKIPDPHKKNYINEELTLVDGYSLVDYTSLIPILTRGIQEQQQIIDQQNDKIQALEEAILEIKRSLNNKK